LSSEARHSRSRRAALLGLVMLAGCGFAPVFGSNGAASGLRNAVEIAAPATAEGYRIRQQLLDRLGDATEPRHLLTVTIVIVSEPVAITAEGVTTRFNLPGTADWTLSDPATGALLAEGQETAFASYSATGNTVTTRSGEQDARDRLAVMLADQIVTRLIIAAPALTSG